MLSLEAIPAILYFGFLFFVPESPRWLIKNKKSDEGLEILTKVNGVQKANEILAEIENSLTSESGTLGELFKPGMRMAMIIGIVLAMISQITGINAIIYYAPEIFKTAGFGYGNCQS